MKSLIHEIAMDVSLWEKIPDSDYEYGCDRIVRPVQFQVLATINAIINNFNNLNNLNETIRTK